MNSTKFSFETVQICLGMLRISSQFRRDGFVFVSVSSVIVKQRDDHREIRAVVNLGDQLHEGLRSGAPAPPGSYTAGSWHRRKGETRGRWR